MKNWTPKRSQQIPSQIPDYTLGGERRKGRLRAIGTSRLFWILLAALLFFFVLHWLDSLNSGVGTTMLIAHFLTGRLPTVRDRKRRNVIEGDVVHFREWHETSGSGQTARQYMVWSYSIERFDKNHNPLPLVPVQMRGLKFTGSLRDGDRVAVRARWQAGKTLHIQRAVNLTSGATVKAKKHQTGLIVANILFLLFLGGIVMAMCSAIPSA